MKQALVRNLSHIPGWRTSRKIIVFLVDDWGSIRIHGHKAREALRRAGVNIDSNRFNKYDTLASEDDLTSLFDVLASFRDRNEASPCFTALATVANPDFDRIRQSGFKTYFYDPFTRTLERYYRTDKVFELWKQGMEQRLFEPQFHGREHLNVNRWLKGLRMGEPHLIAAFDQHSIGVPLSGSESQIGNYLAAFDPDNENELEEYHSICRDGLHVFRDTFGYDARLFTSSSLIHPQKMEKALAENGIQFIDRARLSSVPTGNGAYKRKFFRLGQKNPQGQIYLTRNCMFEPNQNSHRDSVDEVMSQIKLAFRWNKPAIISSHRVNFVGSVEKANRDRGLVQLKELLRDVLCKWADAEFMTGSELGNLMKTAGETKN